MLCSKSIAALLEYQKTGKLTAGREPSPESQLEAAPIIQRQQERDTHELADHRTAAQTAKHPPRQPEGKQMTSIYESHFDRDEDVDNVVECIEDLAELEWKFPIGTIMDSAQNLPQEVRDGLEKLQRAVGMLVSDGPNILWAFAKAMEITDEVAQRLDVDSNSPLVRDLIWLCKDAK